MKHYAYLLILLLICTSCRSSRNTTDTRINATQQENTTQISNEISVSQKQQQTEEKTQVATHVIEKITTIHFDTASGKIQSIQTVRRRTGRNELSAQSGRTTDVSITQKTDSTVTDKQSNIQVTEKKEKESDTRLIQGWKEWGIVILIVSAIIALAVWGSKHRPPGFAP